MKKLIILATAAIIMVACGKKEAATSGEVVNSNGKKVVTVWAWDKNFNIYAMQQAEKIYETAHPDVDIQIVDYAQADIITKLNTGLSSGMMEGLPEIALIEDNNARKFLSSYPGYFANLKGSIDHSKFASYKVEAMTDADGIYGVPFDSGVTGFFYRKDIMENAGFKAEDLNNITWDKFVEIGKVVKAKTGVDMFAGDMTGDAGLIRVMMQSAGKWYFDKSGNVDIANNDALKASFEVMKKFKDNKTMKPTSGWGEWVGAFNKGETASVVTGIWIMGSIKAAADQSGKWAVANTPKLAGVASSVNASNLGGSSWYVLEKSPNKDAAIDFMKTVWAGDDAFYQGILTEIGAMATYLPSQSGEAYNKADEFFGGQTVYQDFSKWVKEIPSVNYGAYVSEADAAVLNALKVYLDGKATLDAALKTAEEEVKAQIR